MGVIRGFAMSLGMFSVIPVPKGSWDEKYMRLTMPALPFVGLLIGAIWYGAAYFLKEVSAPLMIQSAIALFIPFFMSGFIHVDGYMDSADAVLSRRDTDEKRRILKDPHVGAFAVIAIIMLMIFQLCSVYTVLETGKHLIAFVFIPVISRCAAGAAMLCLKPAFESGYAVSFRKGTTPRHTVFICATALACLAAAGLTLRFSAWPLLAEALVAAIATVYLYRQINGMSGDLAGCIITVSEFAALLCCALAYHD